MLDVALAALAVFGLAWLSAVAGFGGGALALLVFTALFGLRTAVPTLTLTQLASNGSRLWLNRRDVQWPIVGRFALGAVPFAFAGGLLLAAAPLPALKRVLGLFLLTVVVWRRLNVSSRRPSPRAFVAIGGASGLGSALLGSVGPLTAPFFLAYGLVRDAYIGTEATCALVMHVTKLAAYGAGSLLGPRVLVLGLVFTPVTLAGAWLGKRTVDRISDRAFVLLVEAGLVVAGVLFLVAG